MKITVIQEGDDDSVTVWASLEVDSDPRIMTESFIIGEGATRDEAIVAALVELEAARRALEADEAAKAHLASAKRKDRNR